MDSKLIQGILIASCVLLLFAIIMTLVDVSKYPKSMAVPPVPAPISAGAKPAAAPAPGTMEVPAETPEAMAEPVEAAVELEEEAEGLDEAAEGSAEEE